MLREKERTFTPAMRAGGPAQARAAAVVAPPTLGIDAHLQRAARSLTGGYYKRTPAS